MNYEMQSVSHIFSETDKGENMDFVVLMKSNQSTR